MDGGAGQGPVVDAPELDGIPDGPGLGCWSAALASFCTSSAEGTLWAAGASSEKTALRLRLMMFS